MHSEGWSLSCKRLMFTNIVTLHRGWKMICVADFLVNPKLNYMIASGKNPFSRPVARYFVYTNLCHLFLMPISIFLWENLALPYYQPLESMKTFPQQLIKATCVLVSRSAPQPAPRCSPDRHHVVVESGRPSPGDTRETWRRINMIDEQISLHVKNTSKHKHVLFLFFYRGEVVETICCIILSIIRSWIIISKQRWQICHWLGVKEI